jgi:hypothetical protein
VSLDTRVWGQFALHCSIKVSSIARPALHNKQASTIMIARNVDSSYLSELAELDRSMADVCPFVSPDCAPSNSVTGRSTQLSQERCTRTIRGKSLPVNLCRFSLALLFHCYDLVLKSTVKRMRYQVTTIGYPRKLRGVHFGSGSVSQTHLPTSSSNTEPYLETNCLVLDIASNQLQFCQTFRSFVALKACLRTQQYLTKSPRKAKALQEN